MAAIKPGDENGMYSSTPYDDAFRTMEGECDDLLIPLVNYFFNEEYGEEARIIRLRNEHFIEHPDGSEEKRITDSHFCIIQKGVTKRYHLECESGGYDSSILLRMFEYTSQIAIDDAEKGEAALIVRFPYVGLLLLSNNEDTPDKAEIRISTPEEEISYYVSIIKRQDIGLDEIFEKRLYFLIPFYIFNYRNKLSVIEKDEERQEELLEKYREIYRRLRDALKERKVTLFSYGVIIESMRRVSYNMTLGHETVQKKVGDMMGGQIMDLEWIRVWKDGKTEGKKEGR